MVIDKFKKLSWTIPLKNDYSQSITTAFSQIAKTLKRESNLLVADDGKEFVKETFNDYLNNNNIRRYSEKISFGAVAAEQFHRTMRNLLKKTEYRRGIADWLSQLPSVIEKYKNTFYSSTKITPTQAF